MSEPFVEVVPEADLHRRVAQLGIEIAEDYGDAVPIVVGVLKGSLPFLADLSRAIDTTIEVDFLSLTRFGEEGRVSIAMDISVPIRGRDVLIVEDIVDTGLTLTALRRMLETRDPNSIRTAALLDKAPRRIVEVDVEYRGFEIGDEFLLGYGLDWAGLYRNVRSLWAVMDLAALAENPGRFSEIVHGTAGGAIIGS
jgi:hypoxanthine phosphoribosyltransferase